MHLLKPIFELHSKQLDSDGAIRRWDFDSNDFNDLSYLSSSVFSSFRPAFSICIRDRTSLDLRWVVPICRHKPCWRMTKFRRLAPSWAFISEIVCTYQWYQSSQPSHPIIGVPSSTRPQAGQIQTWFSSLVYKKQTNKSIMQFESNKKLWTNLQSHFKYSVCLPVHQWCVKHSSVDPK